MGGVADQDLYETPGEALLVLVGLSLFGLCFPLGFVLFMAGVHLVALLPIVVIGEVGLVLEYRVETRIARRHYPELRRWQRIVGVGENRVRKELVRAGVFRDAARRVTASPRDALRSIPDEWHWWRGTLLVGTIGTLLSVGVLFSNSGSHS